jgi:hypothetical protein
MALIKVATADVREQRAQRDRPRPLDARDQGAMVESRELLAHLIQRQMHVTRSPTHTARLEAPSRDGDMALPSVEGVHHG